MWFLYLLLIIIAIGVLLLSSEGKSILNTIITIAAICGLLYLAFWVVVLALGFALSDTGKEIMGALAFWVSLFIIGVVGEKLIKRYNHQLKNNFITRNKKKIVIGFWVLWPLSFAIAYFAGNYLENENIMLFFLTLSIAIFPIVGLLLLSLFGIAKSEMSKI